MKWSLIAVTILSSALANAEVAHVNSQQDSTSDYEISIPNITPRWSIDQLTGVRSYHNGANCFNGAAAALGYVDQLVQMNTLEFRYYLEVFCTSGASLTKPGSLLVTFGNGHPGHTALVVASGQIFEKGSTAGFYSNRSQDSTYKVESWDQSENLRECKAPKCAVQGYDCESSMEVRKKLADCRAVGQKIGLEQIRDELQKVTFDRSREISLSGVIPLIPKITHGLAQIDGGDSCALYLLGQAESAISHIVSVQPNFNGARDLWPAMNQLANRIQTIDHSEVTARVMYEWH